MQTVDEIIKKAGGYQAVADRIGSKSRKGGTAVDAASTVYKWTKSGIPERHWPVIMQMTKVSIGKIFAANQRARGVHQDNDEVAA